MDDEIEEEPRSWRYSTTQVESFDMCPRKWAWRYIDGIKGDPKNSLELGKAVHSLLAKWLAKGEVFDTTTPEGKVALRGVAMLPPPKTPELELEQGFVMKLGGFNFIGFLDMQRYDSVRPLVHDHKTTKDLRYAKSAEDLEQDPQACLYAAYAMSRAKSDACDLSWLYFPTVQDRKAKLVTATLTRDQVTPTLERIVDSARKMQMVRDSKVTASQVPCNPDACGEFGGCQYQKLCGGFTPRERLRAVMAQQQSLDEFLQSLGSKPPAINPPPATTQAPAAQAAPPVINQPSAPPQLPTLARQPLVLPPATTTPPSGPEIPRAAGVPTLPSPATTTPPKGKKTASSEAVPYAQRLLLLQAAFAETLKEACAQVHASDRAALIESAARIHNILGDA